MPADALDRPVTALRLDKYLWFARMARTRSAAARLCADGKVTVGGSTALKPHHRVRIGDWIAIENGGMRRRIRVLDFAAWRGNPAAARLLYDEPAPAERLTREPWTPLLDEESWEPA